MKDKFNVGIFTKISKAVRAGFCRFGWFENTFQTRFDTCLKKIYAGQEKPLANFKKQEYIA